MPDIQLVLASTSPRRIELLTQAGLNPQVIAPHTDESILPREAPRAMVARLAREKAEAVAAKLITGNTPGAIIIAADTTVVAPHGKILGKPENERDARRMLGVLSGKMHTVLTGYCILKITPGAGAKKALRPFHSHVLVRVVQSRVKIRPLSRSDIAKYVATGEPMDKAGSYAAQGIGTALIDSITGSYSNVVGLPICQVLSDLEKRFGISWLPS